VKDGGFFITEDVNVGVHMQRQEQQDEDQPETSQIPTEDNTADDYGRSKMDNFKNQARNILLYSENVSF
jgi:hypothetical protein